MVTIKILIDLEKKLLDIDNSDLKYNLELNDLFLLKKYLKSIGEITDLFFNLQVDYANTIKDEENYADVYDASNGGYINFERGGVIKQYELVRFEIYPGIHSIDGDKGDFELHLFF